jgi:hypothetical protein
MVEFSNHNIFEMLVQNGGPGFWVQRTTWSATQARVVGVGKFTAPAPYFGNPPVVMDVFSLGGDLRDSLAKLPCPGTYKTWREIAPPLWSLDTNLRPLDDPSIAETIIRMDRRRTTSPAIDLASQIALDVPFERKDEARKIGAKWSAADKKWWLKRDNSKSLEQAFALGFIKQLPI